MNHDTGLRIVLQSCDHQQKHRVNHPQCAGIPVPPNDTIHQIYPDQTCMPFVRTIPCPRCRLGPRSITSSVTAAQDLSAVYGVSTDMSNDRRTMTGGLLKSQFVKGEELFAVERTNSSGRFRCLGEECEASPLDVRNLQFVPAQALVLLFYRRHNMHARRLAEIKPSWTDEQLFQEARRRTIAEHQHCVFNEYVTTLIGRELADRFHLLPKSTGQFSNYKPDVVLKTVVEFQSAAGRAGHAALTENLDMIDPENGAESSINFLDVDMPERVFLGGHTDKVFYAQILKPSFVTTPSVPFKTFLLNVPGRTFGLDLAALDTQRQRDHGIPGYIHYIKYCHNVEIRLWEDLLKFMDSKNVGKLRKLYKYVEDVDLYVGGHFENQIKDGLIGPTFGCIIGIQLYNSKFGDRFYYEHGKQIGSFKMDQLNEIKRKVSLASILCKTTKLKKVTRDPLRLHSETNPFVSCSEFQDIDYKLETNEKSSSLVQFFLNLISPLKNIFSK